MTLTSYGYEQLYDVKKYLISNQSVNYVHVYQTQWPFIISVQESTYIVTPESIYILVYHV